MASQIKVGDKAPNFTLPNVDLKPRSLKEFMGQKTVLAFFVGAFTSTCTKDMWNAQKVISLFKSYLCVVQNGDYLGVL
jgi:peroxiredoxin